MRILAYCLLSNHWHLHSQLDRRRGRLRCFRIGQRDLGHGSQRRCLGGRLWRRLFDDGGAAQPGATGS
jgi:hypothetical protein